MLSQRITLWLGGVLGFLALTLGHASWGVGLVLGTAWSALNLRVWSSLVPAVVTPLPRAHLKIWTTAVLKFPVLYGGGYLLLDALVRRGWCEVTGVIVGVSLPLVVLVAKAVRRIPPQPFLLPLGEKVGMRGEHPPAVH